MPGKRRKRRRYSDRSSSSSSHRRPWEKRDADEESAHVARQKSGDSLSDMLLVLYANGTLDAKAVCILAHHATEAGVQHDIIKRIARPPDLQAGKYAAHLRKHLPLQESAPEMNALQLPMTIRNRRTIKPTLVSPLHEALEAELALLDTRVKPGDERRVFPIAIYIDGIKFTRSIGPGRADSLACVTGYNMATDKRHVLYVLSKREMCRCGCRGWDTLWGCPNHLRWSLAAAAEGNRPDVRWGGSDWPGDSAYSVGKREAGTLQHRYVLCQIKADWAEFCTSLGFPAWSSFHCPCFMCACRKAKMFDFNGITVENHNWGDRPLDYEAACRNCEVEVHVEDEDTRRALLEHAKLKHKKKLGRVITQDAPHIGPGLLKGDRLVPSVGLHDAATFETQPTPFVAVFWRSHFDNKNRKTDWIHCRNPIFSEGVGATPHATMRLDTMHTLYLGVFSRYVHYVMEVVIDTNMYNVAGTKDEVKDVSVRLLFNGYKRWCFAKDIELSYQLNALLPTMLGSNSHPYM
ncbi:unnamed protein product [Prorocentrum cordatum]|uniref:Uncharacterized protein n=1 Tax=Prorocentrum cordatum TaxID=2364126 RepID=A0ABN9RDC3_9DINO|nr:unnamed protein product [Polarella glacialis]